MKNNKGITLIALVVTIIVLLILAGVSIAMLTGQNGILNRASEASYANAISDAKDKIGLEVNNCVTDYYAGKYAGYNVTGVNEASTGADLGTIIQTRLTTLKTEIDKGTVTLTLTPKPTDNSTTVEIKVESKKDANKYATTTLTLADGTLKDWTNHYTDAN